MRQFKAISVGHVPQMGRAKILIADKLMWQANRARKKAAAKSRQAYLDAISQPITKRDSK